jgi:hypothetical protein
MTRQETRDKRQDKTQRQDTVTRNNDNTQAKARDKHKGQTQEAVKGK